MGGSDGHVTVTGHQQITLICGPVSLTLHSDGRLALHGSQEIALGVGNAALVIRADGVHISGPNFTVAADAEVVLTGPRIKLN